MLFSDSCTDIVKVITVDIIIFHSSGQVVHHHCTLWHTKCWWFVLSALLLFYCYTSSGIIVCYSHFILKLTCFWVSHFGIIALGMFLNVTNDPPHYNFLTVLSVFLSPSFLKFSQSDSAVYCSRIGIIHICGILVLVWNRLTCLQLYIEQFPKVLSTAYFDISYVPYWILNG